jgi:P-type conjugative transfer protein TrbJ
MLPKSLRSAAAVAVLVGMGVSLTSPPPLAAQIPVTDVAHIGVATYHQVIHYVARAYEIYQKALQIYNQYEQIRAQLQALRKLDDPNWREVASLLWMLEKTMQQGRSLAYSLSDITEQLAEIFPGWEPRREWTEEHRLQVTRALDTMKAAMATIRREGNNFIPDQYTLGRIKSQMGGVKGHQEALELLATIGTYHAEETLLARQAMAVNSNIHAVYYGYLLNREAQNEAGLQLSLQRSLRGALSDSQGFTAIPPALPLLD